MNIKRNSKRCAVVMRFNVARRLYGRILVPLVLLSFSFAATAQKKADDVYVDKNGVMRWGQNKEEVHAFGINYTAMFAHAYRAAKKLNVPIEQAIDNDVYHFSRLGFDFFRVHVWDTEISDTVGNLLSNDHLKLFDYALAKMKSRGMKFVLTPIAYWGNGWPEPDEKTPGFARKFGKDACLINPDAIKAQETYLFQFLNHVNAYTGVAYKDDPDIIGFEISNEPHHKEAPEKVTAFIDRMVSSMRKTGTGKPIFYNVSHSIHLADAYFNAPIQGGTFQWYPTGLGAGHELGGNLLPNVDRYTIPFSENSKFKKAAKMVYEFDAADVGRSYIYPAMARSFREAGLQIAAHFAYDPTFMAHVNTEYGTHYMNLAYAPQKALSLMIASEVFHQIPMYKSFGRYPSNTSFGEFHVSYEKDLAEMVSAQKFLYTNNTTSVPPAIGKLEQVAGFGNSAVVTYAGQGAYFLDRLENGVWRLEVMPDAVWIEDPFTRTSPKKTVALINWRTWPVSIDLPDLGEEYSIKGINEGNSFSGKSTLKSFEVFPGTYILSRSGVTPKIKPDDKWKNIVVKEFSAPQQSLKQSYVRHTPAPELTSGTDYLVEACVVTTDKPESVELFLTGRGFRPEVFAMNPMSGSKYQATVSPDLVKEGFLRYHIVVKVNGLHYTYPSGVQTHPRDWDFFERKPYMVPVVQKEAPVFLFNALTDTDDLTRQWIRSSALVPAAEPGQAELRVNVEKLFTADPENKNGLKVFDYSIRHFAGNKISGRHMNLGTRQKIILHGRSLNDKPCKIQLALVTAEGDAYGASVELDTESKDYTINIGDLKKVKLVTLPRPYPTFLPYFFEDPGSETLDLTKLESLQFSIGPGIPEDEVQLQHGVAIESVRLE